MLLFLCMSWSRGACAAGGFELSKTAHVWSRALRRLALTGMDMDVCHTNTTMRSHAPSRSSS